MANISQLGQLAPAEPLDMDKYELSSGKPRSFPKRGRYTFRAPEQFTEASFGKTAAKNLTAQIDPTIADGPHAGFQLRFIRISVKTFPRGSDTVSMVSDYLKACGQSGTLSGDPQEAADKIEQTANLTYDAYVDWRLFARGHGEGGTDLVIEGMENFPSDGNGGYLPYVPSKTQKDEAGDPQMLRANLVIKRFIAKEAQ